MTTLERPVKRETAVWKRDGGRARALVIELYPSHMALRRKGTRRPLLIGYEAVYDAAAKLVARAVAREKDEARKAKRKGGKR
jgi:hypothetical protein